jgi:hypothetical protein
MKKFLLAALIFIGFAANAQIFSPAGAEWNYRLNKPWTSGKYAVTYSYVADTVINGITAQKITRSTFASYYLPAYYFYSTADAIYCYSFAHNVFTKLFDYTMNVGDSLFIWNVDASCATDTSGNWHKVIGKGADVINGTSYRWVNYEYMYGNGFPEYLIGKYYEKLGRADGFFAPELGCIADADYIDCNRRYWDNVDTVDNTSVCLLTGVNENPVVEFSLYPNPTTNGTLTIQSKATVKSIELIDMLGQIVLSTTLTGNTVNTGSVAEGMYVAKVVFADGKVGYKKILIE